MSVVRKTECGRKPRRVPLDETTLQALPPRARSVVEKLLREMMLRSLALEIVKDEIRFSIKYAFEVLRGIKQVVTEEAFEELGRRLEKLLSKTWRPRTHQLMAPSRGWRMHSRTSRT